MCQQQGQNLRVPAHSLLSTYSCVSQVFKSMLTVTTVQTATHPNLQATSRGVWPRLLRMLTNIAMARAAAFGFLFLLR